MGPISNFHNCVLTIKRELQSTKVTIPKEKEFSMTEMTVKISITTEINAKTIKREISVDAGCLDSEMIKLKVDVIREAIMENWRRSIIKYEKEKL